MLSTIMLNVVMLSFIMLSAIMLSVIILSVIILSAIVLNVVIRSVVAPCRWPCSVLTNVGSIVAELSTHDPMVVGSNSVYQNKAERKIIENCFLKSFFFFIISGNNEIK